MRRWCEVSVAEESGFRAAGLFGDDPTTVGGTTFSAETTADRGLQVVVVSGEVDLAARGELVQSAKAVMAAGTTLVLDMRHVTFLDSAGLNGLLEIRSAASALGAAMVLRQPSERVLYLLSITGLLDAFPLED